MLVRIPGTYNPFMDTIISDILSQDSKMGTPAVDVAEFDNHYEIVSELPGLKREDIKISLEDGSLTLSGERKPYAFPEGTAILRQETSKEPFARSFTVPDGIDSNSITAELKDGILRIQLPKTERIRAKEISIR